MQILPTCFEKKSCPR